jgi:hypothetical protein
MMRAIAFRSWQQALFPNRVVRDALHWGIDFLTENCLYGSRQISRRGKENDPAEPCRATPLARRVSGASFVNKRRQPNCLPGRRISMCMQAYNMRQQPLGQAARRFEMAGDNMFNFFTIQYWQWATLLPQLLPGTQIDTAISNGMRDQRDNLPFSRELVATRKPLRRRVRYDRARKHL